MRLYSAKRVPNGRRTEIFLAEKGISVPAIYIDLGKLEHRSDNFTALNPLQRVPVLELDDGTVITESIAICRYFEALQPEPALFGRTALEQARIEMWNRRLEIELYFAVQYAFRHLHPGMASLEVPQVPEWGEVNKARAVAFMRFIDAQLRGKPFICGDAFSVADITGLVALDFTKVARITVPDDLAELKRWHATISARPSVSAV